MGRSALLLIFLLSLGCCQKAGNDSYVHDIEHYINTKLLKNDGGYGWEDQYDGHLTPSYAVTGILFHLGRLPENRQALAEYIKSHHPQRGPNKEAGPSGAEMRNLVFQQIQSLVWLGTDTGGFEEEVSAWQSQAGKLANYEMGGNPVFMQEMMTPVCRNILKLPQKDDMLAYILERRRDNGSFNNVPAAQGGDGNILNTYWGLYALSILAGEIELKEATIKWLQDCQTDNGGFTHQPKPEIGANDDVAYTWAAVKALKILDAEPGNVKSCVKYLASLQNEDGGFGNRIGWPSNPMATFYAIEALSELKALSQLKGNKKQKNSESQPDFTGYRVFTVQFQAHGTGSPKEAVFLADKFKIDLWGAKNATKKWLKEAQRVADEKNIKTVFFHSDEDHGANLMIEGHGNFGHIVDPAYPAGSNFSYEPGDRTWNSFKSDYLEPLLNDDGALLLQISNNEPLSRVLLDESVNRKGYGAISTIHFSQNFLFWLPHLNQYRYKLPFVALQDGHGPETWWWMHELAAYRTLFIAKEPTYEEFIQALRKNWVVAVRHDEVSGYKTRMLGGAAGVQEFIKAKEDQWRWWVWETNEPSIRPASGPNDGKVVPISKTEKPAVVITVVMPDDKFEAERPERGIVIRIRTRWESNRQNLRLPQVRLDKLEVDGREANATYVERKFRNTILDAYYIYKLPNPSVGEHIAKAYVTDLQTGKSEIIVESITVRR